MADAPTGGGGEDTTVHSIDLSTLDAEEQRRDVHLYQGCKVNQYQTVNVNQQDAPNTREKSKMLIDNVRQPNRHFISTSVYETIKENVKDKVVSILHLYGMPGSGKSEIICNLAAIFPKDDNDLVAKWHIECSDCSHDIKDQLEKFANALFKNGLVDDCGLETAIDGMKSDRSRGYLNFTKKAHIPVLIIIEDPQGGDKEFLDDFVKCVHQVDFDKKFHLYITSKSKSVINCTGLDRFNQKNIQGFELQEGLQMLGVSDDTPVEEKQAAEEIITELSSSPLGLRVVAATLEKSCLSLTKYLTLIREDKKSPLLSVGAEKFSPTHLHNAIIKLLRPERMDEDNTRNWKAISALSLCHHGSIPTVLVARIMQNIRSGEHDLDETYDLSKAETSHFLKSFEDFGLCKVESDSYGETVTFHQVVFSAVRRYLKANNQLAISYPVAVQALASIVHKDLRKSIDSAFMKSMVPHMSAVVTQYERLVDDNKIKGDDYLLHFCTSHLYEVMGIVMSSEKDATNEKSIGEQNLEKGIYVLSRITENLGSKVDIKSFFMANPPAENKCEAEKLVNDCLECGKMLLQKSEGGFKLEDYISIIFRMPAEEIKYAANFADDQIIDLVKHANKLHLKVPAKKLAEFQKKNIEIFLSKENLYEIYFVERFASIFHTLSRSILYDHDEISTERAQIYKGFSTLAFQLSEICYRKSGVATLFRSITAIGLVDIRLKALKNDPKKGETLVELKAFVTEHLLNKNHDGVKYYEHGLIKQVKGHIHAELSHYRSLVHINNKLLSIETCSNVENFNSVCKHLQERALENLDQNIWDISLKCLVYCSKFWSLTEYHRKAADTILVVVQNPNIKRSLKTYFWACKNFAKIVVRGKLHVHKELVTDLCTDVLKEEHNIPQKQAEKIREYLTEIQEM